MASTKLLVSARWGGGTHELTVVFMKLGFVTAILPELSLNPVLEFAAADDVPIALDRS